MQTYLVGGAVRDELLGLPAGERDWVVVGATPETMIERGFKPVGRHFPVFLHPETKEEYALARTERKVGFGYHGFEFHTGSGVTLEEDLFRRDLTINAIARDSDGNLIDPYGGQADLESRILRHVSPAFVEDPVRVLRVARFAARFYPAGFRVAPETIALMSDMVACGETGNLVAERVWKECETALSEPAPSRFFVTLEDAGVLTAAAVERMPAVADLLRSQGTVDAMAKVVDSCAAASQAGDRARLALIVLAIELASQGIMPGPICESLRMPSAYSKLAKAAASCWSRLNNSGRLDARTLLDIFECTAAFRGVEPLLLILNAWRFCNFPIEGCDKRQSLSQIREAFHVVSALDLRQIAMACEGNAGEAVRKARLQVLSQKYGE